MLETGVVFLVRVIKRSMGELTDEIVGMALENTWLRIFIAGYVSSNVTIMAMLTVILWQILRKSGH